MKTEVKPEPGSEPFAWLRPGGGLGVGVGEVVKSPLTLTVYFSGRYTLVGARHETEVYRVCERVALMLWPFRQRGVGTQDGVGYDEWRQRAEEEERRRGRMGWEDEAERVRQLLTRRELRQQRADGEQKRQERGGEPVLRVKAEPGREEGLPMG